MTIAFYISGHGFGHATRSFEVARALLGRRADLRLIVRSQVPRWFIARSLGGRVDADEVETDVGVIQIDSLALDEEATARAAGAFYATFDERVRAEAQWLRQSHVTLVVFDAPPLAAAAAHAAGVPSVAVTNFTWDWIYSIYPAFPRLAPHVIPAMGEAYARTSLALRLPFAGGFETMPVVRDIPLVARRSRLGQDAARQALHLDASRPIVLASFGGHGARLPFEAIAEESGATLLLTDYEAATAPAPGGALRRVTNAALAAGGLEYPDLVAAADIVASKPGYGIVSECIANGAALLYTSRGHFAEYPIMVEGMARALKARFIAQEDVREGRWRASIWALMAQPAVPPTLATDGASVAADAILALAESR